MSEAQIGGIRLSGAGHACDIDAIEEAGDGE